MKFVILTYDDSEVCLEAIGPETIIGIVTDVMRGNYNDGQKTVTKIEIGNSVQHSEWKAA